MISEPTQTSRNQREKIKLGNQTMEEINNGTSWDYI